MEQETISIQRNTPVQDEILRAALGLFVQKSYLNTSLSDIALAAKLDNIHELYRYFENKQHIACVLYSNIVDSLSVSIDDIRRRNKKSTDQLHSLVDLLFKLVEQAPDALRFLLTVNHAEFLRDEKPFLKTPAVNKMLKIFQLGINNGEIRALEPMLIYSCFFGIIYTTLELILNGTLDKKSELYQSQAWIAAWNTIAKK
ncbi:MAG TPA: TetR/AcrR family transcriptional regulator [Methylococcaceae bacterium]|nr:TetR/AcrR family transcriptional regulator [Methylococcaceae bacterium]